MAYTRTQSRFHYFSPNLANFSVPPPDEIGVLSDVRTGTKVEHWRTAIKAGTQAGSNYSRTSYILNGSSPGFANLVTCDFIYEGQVFGPNYSTEQVSGYPVISGGRVPYDHHLAWDASDVDGEALTLLYKKIRQETSHMNGLQFLGELREALRMIRKPALAIQDGLISYDRLLRKRKESVAKLRIPVSKKLNIWKDVIAGTWLEVSFGWKPLVQDTKDIAETIGRILLPDSGRTRVRAYKEKTSSLEPTATNNSWHNSTILTVTNFTYVDAVYGVQYIVGLKMIPVGPTSAVNRMRNLSGLTLENFVPTLYELTPWSFLLDYFTNVGDIINSAFTNTANVTWQMRTTRLRTTRTCVSAGGLNTGAFNPPYFNYIDSSFKTAYSSVVKSTVSRQILTHLEIPDISFSLPGSNYKWANIAALASSRYHSTFRKF